MSLRVRVPELLKARGMTAYQLAKASEGRISLSAAYRLVRARGRIGRFDAPVVEALCDVLDVEPGELFERERPTRRKARGA
jgi:DNA-binding Xre family transcriptional regulator